MSSIANKVVIVTGAAKGIGAYSVLEFLKEGAKFVAALDVDEKAGLKLEDELKVHGNVKFFKCDVTDDDQLTSIFLRVKEENGFIDIVVNNAGIANESNGMHKKLLEINCSALVSSTLKAIELMRQDRSGRGGIVINTSSAGALSQVPYLPIYSASKMAVLHFSNSIGALENYRKTGVKVITICIGFTVTDLVTGNNVRSFDADNDFTESTKMHKSQRPESAARALVEACKRGESGSTWFSSHDRPVRDITPVVRKAFSAFVEVLAE